MSAITSGSPLACLDGVAGEQVENACEQAVFADAQSAAKAVAYVGARLALLSDAAIAARGDRDFLAVFATGRRAIELDRYGIAAHVLWCATAALPSAARLWLCFRIPAH